MASLMSRSRLTSCHLQKLFPARSDNIIRSPLIITANWTATQRARNIANQLAHPNRQFSTSSTMSSPENNNLFKLNELFSVRGKIALVSGGGSGIGLMCTQALAVNGAKVYIVGRTKEKLDTVAEKYGQGIEGQIIPMQGDITDKKDIARMIKELEGKEPRLDILINNAGIASATFQTEASSAEEMKKNLFDHQDSTMDDWLDTYRTNVPQCFFMTLGFLPMLNKATDDQHGYSGTALNITSISGIVKTAQHHFSYNASKAAAIHLTTMLSSEIASNNLKVRVNSIAPGVFPSEMTANESDENQKSELPKENFEGKVPANRPGTDRDFGNAVLFAVTNQYLNGQTIAVDGGYIIRHGSA